jgi:hypothetical protein
MMNEQGIATRTGVITVHLAQHSPWRDRISLSVEQSEDAPSSIAQVFLTASDARKVALLLLEAAEHA